MEKVGRHDSFFDLGGHSLLAIQLQVRLREKFDVEPSIRKFFQTGVLREMADEINLLRISFFDEKDIQDIEKDLDNLLLEELEEILKN